MKFKIQFLEIY